MTRPTNPERPIRDFGTSSEGTERFVMGSDGDDAVLDRLFASFIERMQTGEPAGLNEAIDEHPHLRDRIQEIYEVACQIRVRPADAMPSIDRYELLGEIGRGGMGVVYCARDHELGRVVALKSIAAAATSSTRGRQRFAREVRVAAGLGHPNIVPVYEVGEAEGVPFFTMEFVDGRSLSDVLSKLPRPFQPDSAWIDHVCRVGINIADALAHAHASGVVHRDVKPSNIMIRQDGVGLLFDFGLAADEENPSLTRTGEFMGSPLYVSPEQAESSDTLDGRTDVYSLGVTLYEALTGRVPFQGTHTQEILRKITSSEPTAPRRLNKKLDKDLETIVLKAMEKDRNQRYAGALDFGEDLRRYLDRRPILAKPSGWSVRLLRLAQRNRAASLSALGGLFVALGLVTALLVQSWLSERELEAEVENTLREKGIAETEAQKAVMVRDFLADMIAAAGHDRMGPETRVIDGLESMANRLENGGEDIDPEVEVTLLNVIGKTYSTLYEPRKALPVLRRALAIADRELPKNHRDRVLVLNNLAGAVVDDDPVEAERLLIEAHDLATDAWGPDDSLTLMTASAIGDIIHYSHGRFEEALRWHDVVIERRIAVHGEDHEYTVYAMLLMAKTLGRLARFEEANSWLDRSETAMNSLQLLPGHPKRRRAKLVRANLLETQGQHREAADIYRDLVAFEAAELGQAHPTSLDSRTKFAAALLNAYLLEEAETVVGACIADLRASNLAPGALVEPLSIGSRLRITQGRYVEAEAFAREALQLGEKWALTGYRSTPHLHHQLGVALEGQDRVEEAIAAYDLALEQWRQQPSIDQPTTMRTMHNLGRMLVIAGDLERAEEILAEVRERGEEVVSRAMWALYSGTYGICLSHLELWGEAEEILLSSLETMDEEGVDPLHVQRMTVLDQLAHLYQELEDPDESRRYAAMLQECLAQMPETFSPDQKTTTGTIDKD